MLVRLAVDEFWVGHGGADAVARSIVAPGYAPQKALQGVKIRAATANTVVIYVGRAGVTVDGGYPLPAGEELPVQIEDVSKVFVVADPAGNSQQSVTLVGTTAGDTFTLALDGHATAPIASDAAAGAVEDALELLPNIGTGNVGVTGNAGGPYTVEFKGALAKQDFPLLVGVGEGAVNEQQTVVVTGGEAADRLVLTYDGQSTAEVAYDATSAEVAAALKALSNIGDNDVAVTDGDPAGWVVEFKGALAHTDVVALAGVCGKNEQQTVVVTGGAVGDKLVLTHDGQSTAELAYDATSAEIATALKALNNIGDSDVTVTDGDPAGWVVEFTGALAKTDVPALTGVCGKNEKQTVVVTGGAVGDKLVLTYDGQSTAELAYDATSAEIATALKALNNIGDSDVAVTDGDPAGWVVEFTGALAKTDVPALTGVCGKNEKQTVVVTGGAVGDKLVLTYDGQSTAELAYDATSAEIATALKALNNIGDSDVTVTDGDPAGWVVEFTGALAKTDVPALTGVCGKNEKQTITLDAGISDGTFTLTFGGQTTEALAYNVSAADMQTALRGLSSINGANVAVTAGDPGGWVVEFIGTLAYTDVGTITGDGSNLVGDVKDVTVVETLKGNGATVDVTETVKGNLAMVGITETVKGNLAMVGVTEIVKGHEATVGVTETMKGDPGFTLTVTKSAEASAASQYSWIAC